MVLTLTTLSALTASLLVTAFMERILSPVSLLGRFLQLRLTHNPHIAFSIALPPFLQTLLIPAALVAVCVVALKAKDKISRIAFGLIIGGALANILDRFGDGFVTDYFSMGTFPIFNAADICISLGAGMLILEEVRAGKKN